MESGESAEKRATDISNWLKIDAGWKDLYFSGDPNFMYRALFHDEFEVTKNVVDYHRTLLTFVLKPIKFYKSGLDLISVQNGKALDNIGTRPSKPRIIITGSGDITLNLGDEKLVLRAVDGGIKVDSQSMTVTDLSGTREQWSKVYSDFPKIGLGKQTVSWTGNISHLQIIPRWEAVV